MDRDQYEPGLPLDEQAHVHVQDMLLGSASLDVAWAATDWLALEARVPFRAAQIFAHFLGAEGQPLPNYESIHHRTELLAGPADPSLGARFMLNDLGVQGLSVALRAGATLPVGNIEQDPFALGRKGQAHQHLFFGTGTFDPMLGADAVFADGELELGGYTDLRASLYQNRYGYLGPTAFIVGGIAGHSFGLEDWRFRLLPELFLESPARWGERHAQNSGRVDVLLGASAAWRMSDGLELSALVKLTAFSYAPGLGAYTLYAPVFVGVGATWDVPVPGR